MDSLFDLDEYLMTFNALIQREPLSLFDMGPHICFSCLDERDMEVVKRCREFSKVNKLYVAQFPTWREALISNGQIVFENRRVDHVFLKRDSEETLDESDEVHIYSVQYFNDCADVRCWIKR